MKRFEFGYLAPALFFLAASMAMVFPTPECNKLEIGMTYSQAKIACPDLATKPFDRDPKTNQVFFLCPSQHTYIVGDLRTSHMVGFMLTPDWQDTLRLRAALNQDSARAEFAKQKLDSTQK